MQDVLDGALHAAAAEALGVAVAQLHRFVGAGGGAAGHGRAPDRTVDQLDVHLDGRVAARVEDLARRQFDDLHGRCPSRAHRRGSSPRAPRRTTARLSASAVSRA